MKKTHKIPRYCSFNVVIRKLACGREHSVFITDSDLIYSMGSNSHGQLGLGKKRKFLEPTSVGLGFEVQSPLALAFFGEE